MNSLINQTLPPERKRAETQALNVADDGTFSGYASLFGKVDLGRDKVERGAFAASLRQRGKQGIRMLFQHDPAQPIGVWEEIREDAHGLFVQGRILQQSAKGREVLELLRAGAIDGLSIGFKTKKSRTDKRLGVRAITEVDLWEISIVTFPMLPDARVQQVKTHPPQSPSRTLPSVRNFERWLTRDAGLTRSEARIVIAKGYAQIAGKQDAANSSATDLARTIRGAARSLASLNNLRESRK